MPPPMRGDHFLDFELGDLNTRKARETGPLLLVVWRTDCPTCRLAIPFVDRIHRAYPAATVVGVIQNQPNEMRDYMGANGLVMPTFPDTSLKATRSLEVDTVPCYWLVDGEGTIVKHGLGWDRAAYEDLAKSIAETTGAIYTPLVTDTDSVPAFKPG